MNHDKPGMELLVFKHSMIPAVRAMKSEGLCMTTRHYKGKYTVQINYFSWIKEIFAGNYVQVTIN